MGTLRHSYHPRSATQVLFGDRVSFLIVDETNTFMQISQNNNNNNNNEDNEEHDIIRNT